MIKKIPISDKGLCYKKVYDSLRETSLSYVGQWVDLYWHL